MAQRLLTLAASNIILALSLAVSLVLVGLVTLARARVRS